MSKFLPERDSKVIQSLKEVISDGEKIKTKELRYSHWRNV